MPPSRRRSILPDELPGGAEPAEEIRVGGVVLTNRHFAFHEPTRTAIVTDIHLGYEGAASEEGAFFPRVQKKAILERFRWIIARYRPATVIVNGDLKCTFSRNLHTEWTEIREVLAYLRKHVELQLVRGNHDNFLLNILPTGWQLPWVRRLPGIVLTHGHRPVPAVGKKLLVLGHEHPSVRIWDDVGAAVRLQCYLYHPKRRILVLPSFSTLATGYDIAKDGFLSPILRPIPLREFQLIALSEIGLLSLGRMANLVRRRAQRS